MHRTMARPLALRRLHGSAGWSSVGIETSAVGGASTADRELALLSLGLDLLPFSLHETSWVPGGHEEGGEQHHATLEDHERNFLVGKFALETVRELCNTEAGSEKDEEKGD